MDTFYNRIEAILTCTHNPVHVLVNIIFFFHLKLSPFYNKNNSIFYGVVNLMHNNFHILILSTVLKYDLEL